MINSLISVIAAIISIIGFLLIFNQGGTGIGSALIIVGTIIFLNSQLQKAADEVPTSNPTTPPPVTPVDVKINRHNELIERYKNSPLTAEMLTTICSSINYPTKIVIYNDKIQSITNETVHTYNFSEHRVHAFETVIKSVEQREKLKQIARPQVAMAEAINILLDNKYKIYDNAKETFHSYTHSEGHYITYASDHVTMVLKDTLPNRTF